MVRVDEAVVARLKTNGQTFEAVVDCNFALQVKDGKEVASEDLLAADHIFSDEKKGLLASEKVLENVFGTTNCKDIAMRIIKKGELQLTNAIRSKFREQKQKQVLELINRNGIDPRTNLPIPITRIELALEEAKVKIDESKSAEKQLDEIISKLRPVLPIRIEQKILEIHIPSAQAEKMFGSLTKWGKKKKENWNNDGSYSCTLEIPAGTYLSFLDFLNRTTNGNNQVHICDKQ